MGWCSGTEIFDVVVEKAFAHIVDESERKNFIKAIKPVFDAGDWDCESDSEYWDDYLVDIMYEMGQLDEDDYNYYKSFRMNK